VEKFVMNVKSTRGFCGERSEMKDAKKLMNTLDMIVKK